MSALGRTRCRALLLGLFLLGGCGDDPTSPGHGLEVTNASATVNFRVQKKP